MKDNLLINCEGLLGIDPIPQVKEAVDSLVATDKEDDCVLQIKSCVDAMPIISLHYITFFEPEAWTLFLCLDFLENETRNENSSYAIFKDSRFFLIFSNADTDTSFLVPQVDDEEDSLRFFWDAGKNKELAVKLISYYLNLFEMDIADCQIEIRMEDEDLEDMDIDIEEDNLLNNNVEEPLLNFEEQTHIALYEFEFGFLPALANDIMPNETGFKKLMDKDFVFDRAFHYGVNIFLIKKNDIKIDRIENGKSTMVLWTMPEPEDSPLARYIAFKPDFESNKFVVYTLEKAHDFGDKSFSWVFGKISEGRMEHRFVEYPATPEDFARLVMTPYKES